MTERQLRTNYFSNSHLLHLIFQAPGARGPAPGPGFRGLVHLCLALALALPVDSLIMELTFVISSIKLQDLLYLLTLISFNV